MCCGSWRRCSLRLDCRRDYLGGSSTTLGADLWNSCCDSCFPRRRRFHVVSVRDFCGPLRCSPVGAVATLLGLRRALLPSCPCTVRLGSWSRMLSRDPQRPGRSPSSPAASAAFRPASTCYPEQPTSSSVGYQCFPCPESSSRYADSESAGLKAWTGLTPSTRTKDRASDCSSSGTRSSSSCC